MSTPERAWLIDGSLYVFRAWHSVDAGLADRDGWPANAVYGFTRFLLDFLRQQRPARIAVAFDEALASCFRNRIYPDYKANREPAPEELKRQFQSCKRLVSALGIACLSDAEYEADDLIGSAHAVLREGGHAVTIVSADKDLSQLLAEGDEQWDYGRDLRWDARGCVDRHGVPPGRIADMLALVGDPIDNVPGVPGIGRKTAAILLHHFGGLEAVLASVDQIATMRMRGAAKVAQALAERVEQVRFMRGLTGIALDAPVMRPADSYRPGPADTGSLTGLLDELRFGPLTRRACLEWAAREGACGPAG
ncbi:MAG: 5'-3' exonuclease H3TH domain-containing protein [Pseudoxanthomonas sp.]|nr:5'-3' exonuclease H3TH domain-containing protein [Pseudoxanthomonas sp.]